MLAPTRLPRDSRSLITLFVLAIVSFMAARVARAATQEASTGPQIRVVAILRAKPELTAETRNALLAMIRPSRSEPGCIVYEIDQPADDASVFVFYEIWRSRADLDAHFEKPYFKALSVRLADLLVQPADIKILGSIAP
jgi:quinol monooxygenase YgiN